MKILKHTGLPLLLLLSSLLSGCFGTIAPPVVKPRQASPSATPDPHGSYRTSGVWGFETNHFLVIDETGRTNFNSLIVRGYGERCTPPVGRSNVDWMLKPFTNDPVPPLWDGGKKAWTKPVPNPGGLYEMNPLAVQAWPDMNTISQSPDLSPSARPP